MIIEVVCAIIRDESGRMLVAQRSASGSAPLKWEFPGGKVEPGESLGTALARELEEEMGIRIVPGPELPSVSAEIAGRLFRMTAIEVLSFTGEITPLEHCALRWIRPSEFESLDWAPLDVPLLAHLQT